jgi:hypothetical protein
MSNVLGKLDSFIDEFWGSETAQNVNPYEQTTLWEYHYHTQLFPIASELNDNEVTHTNTPKGNYVVKSSTKLGYIYFEFAIAEDPDRCYVYVSKPYSFRAGAPRYFSRYSTAGLTGLLR